MINRLLLRESRLNPLLLGLRGLGGRRVGGLLLFFLGGDGGSLALAGGAGLGLAGFGLLDQLLLLQVVGLLLVDGLDQNALVLEHVTWNFKFEFDIGLSDEVRVRLRN